VANTAYHKNIKFYEKEQRPGQLQWLLKNYDDSSIDKGSKHTKQILAELIETGFRTIHYEILQLNNYIWTRDSAVERIDQHP
jgi:hypothetical protein